MVQLVWVLMMTFQYLLTKELRNLPDPVRKCCNCNRIEFPGLNDWFHYDGSLPPWIKDNVTGTVCPKCFGEYVRGKEAEKI